MNRFIRSFFFILAGLTVQTNLSAAAAAAVAAANPAYVCGRCTHCHRDIIGWQSMYTCDRCASDHTAGGLRCIHKGCRFSHAVGGGAGAAAAGGGAGAIPVPVAEPVDTDAEVVARITTLIEDDPGQLLERIAGGDSILVQGIKLMASTIENPTASEEEILGAYQMIVNPAITALLPHHNERSEFAIAYLDYFITKVGQETDLESGDEATQITKCRRWHWLLTLVDAAAKDIMVAKKQEADRLRSAPSGARRAHLIELTPAEMAAMGIEGTTGPVYGYYEETPEAARPAAAATVAGATRTDAGIAALFATLTTSVARRPAVMKDHIAAFLTASIRATGCAICMSMHRPADRKVAKLDCGHVFHANHDCIVGWIAEHSTCPLCRAPISEAKKAELRTLAAAAS